MTAPADEVIAWYETKTASILRKYGPGPRVHFHIGIPEDVSPYDGLSLDSLRQLLTASQETLVDYACSFWDARNILSGEVLDVGCGLGGVAIYLAEKFGLRVTGLTSVPSHAGIVSRFAAEAGMGARVQTIVRDACSFTSSTQFDAVVAMESACYLPRLRWFSSLSRLVKPGGFLLIEDTFLGKPEAAEPFDFYWKTQVGTVEDYVAAAEQTGFTLEADADFTGASTLFWPLSIAWSEAALARADSPEEEQARLRRSVEWQHRFLEIWRDRGILCRLLRFRHSARD